MTVTIRPIPSRVAGNRVVPFGRVQYTYKPNPVGLRDWKPPVPEPLQPAPLLGLGTLALLGLQALAWAWGLLNSKPEAAAGVPPGYEPPTSTKYTAGIVTRPPGGAGGFAVSYTSPDILPNPTDFTTPASVVMLRIEREYWEDKPWPGTTGWSYIVWGYNEAGELIYGRPFLMGNAPGYVLWDGPLTPNLRLESVNFTAIGSEGTYVPRDLEPIPDLPPARDVEVLPAVAPAPLPLPLPATVPQVVPSTEPNTLPAPSPLVPVTPGPVAPPAIRPATPISPQQPKVPAPTATSNGTVVAPAPVPVPTTPQDAVFPVPGGLPVTGRTMTPTIQAVAQEVGRIEQKIDRMLNPDQGQWGDATDRLQLLWQLLSQIYNALTDGAPAGSYQLSSPCVTGENGDRVASEVEWDEQGTNHGAILARVDAIAALLQVHKDLKQPNCHIPPVAVGGEFVTVNFEQID